MTDDAEPNDDLVQVPDADEPDLPDSDPVEEPHPEDAPVID